MNELRIENISKSYDRRVIDGVSYTFSPGKLYVIKGVSGCGKTTLFNIIGGTEEDYDGKVTHGDIDGGKDREAYRKNVGYIYQNSLLLSGISVLDNLLLIKNDSGAIYALAEALGISGLLGKLPDELSGGERQRVAIVRSLLFDPTILLADEPTASLDADNSRRIAENIASLKNEGKIVLVATHERCFDGLADEIIYLRYGKIDRVEKREPRAVGTLGEKRGEPSRKIRRGVNLWSYAIRRRRQQFRPLALLPFALVILLILIVSTVQNSFEIVYIRHEASKTNADMMCVRESKLPKLDERYRSKLRIYYPYYAEEGDTVANYLADKKDSIFSIDGMIKYGGFPEAENEILVSPEYAEKHGGKDIVGKTVSFADRSFVVSGVTYSVGAENDGRNKDFMTLYQSDFYYRWYHDWDAAPDELPSEIYIPHDTLAEFGDIRPEKPNYEGMRQLSYPGLFSNMETILAFRDWLRPEIHSDPDIPGADSMKVPAPTINDFDHTVQQMQETLDSVALTMLAVFYVCFLIFCIFIRMNVSIELFYRRREIGYLRLFGVGKRRIGRMIVYEYVSRLAASIVMALLIYGLLAGIYAIVIGGGVMFNALHITLAISGAVVFYIVTVVMSVIPVMRKKIIELITA